MPNDFDPFFQNNRDRNDRMPCRCDWGRRDDRHDRHDRHDDRHDRRNDNWPWR